MTESTERINGCRNDRCNRSNWILCNNRSNHSWSMVMGFLAVAGIMFIAFSAGAMITQSGDE